MLNVLFTVKHFDALWAQFLIIQKLKGKLICDIVCHLKSFVLHYAYILIKDEKLQQVQLTCYEFSKIAVVQSGLFAQATGPVCKGCFIFRHNNNSDYLIHWKFQENLEAEVHLINAMNFSPSLFTG